MRKLILMGILIGLVSVVFAGSREVSVTSGGAASSTFGVGIPPSMTRPAVVKPSAPAVAKAKSGAQQPKASKKR